MTGSFRGVAGCVRALLTVAALPLAASAQAEAGGVAERLSKLEAAAASALEGAAGD